MLNYRYRAYQAGIKEQAEEEEMAINGSGIRDTARVFLKINKNTMLRTLQKSQHIVASSS